MKNQHKEIVLHENSVLSWHKVSKSDVTVWFLGRCRESCGRELQGDRAAATALGYTLLGKTPLVNWLKSIDGNYAFVISAQKFAIAAVDIVRSAPLFYRERRNSVEFSTNAADIANGSEIICRKAFDDIYVAGFTSGDRSIYSYVKQILAGQVLVISDGKVEVEDTHNFFSTTALREEPSQTVYENKLTEVLEQTFASLKKSLNGRQACIPLSAGLDSRLVLSGLLRSGHDNVLAFSYGLKSNSDAETARKICQKLGVKWVFIEMKPRKIRKFARSSIYRDYYKFAFRGDSVPFLQDLYAIYVLKECSTHVNAGAVFINGNSGDFISGLHIPKSIHCLAGKSLDTGEIKKVAEAYIDKHFSLWQDEFSEKHKLRLSTHIFDQLIEVSGGSKELVNLTSFESLEWRQRQTKFVVSGQRVYDFYGFDWRLPLWEKPIFEFFKTVPLELKFDQFLYRQTLVKNNWGGVWSDIPINEKKIQPLWVRIARTFAKVFIAPFGREAWKKFDKSIFAYWQNPICSFSYFPFYQSLIFFGKNRNAISIRAKYLCQDLASLGCLHRGARCPKYDKKTDCFNLKKKLIRAIV